MPKSKSRTVKGEQGLSQWYEKHWGSRWETLYPSLLQPHTHVAWSNPWSTYDTDPLWQELQASPHPYLAHCWCAPSFPTPPTDVEGRPAYYLLDSASVSAAYQLDVQSHESVLDVCAAPGGKSLILASSLGEGGQLTANDLSKNRFHRLRRVLSSHMGEDSFKKYVQTTHYDASRWCLYETEAYDKILLDVPCSSERHVLADPNELKRWTPARSKQLAFRQYAILASALEVLRIGGRMVYSTCSISPLECDHVIQRLLKKKKERVRVVDLVVPEEHTVTDYGAWLLPDQQAQSGPIYMCLLERVS